MLHIELDTDSPIALCRDHPRWRSSGTRAETVCALERFSLKFSRP